MTWLDTLFMRRRIRPQADRLTEETRRRLRHACRELSESERLVAQTLSLDDPPRMVLVDEETGVILPVGVRRQIGGET